MNSAIIAMSAAFESPTISLSNRIVMAPMTRWMCPGQYPGNEVAAYYRRRAEGGVGLIITEGTTINHPVSSHSERTPAFYGRALDGWRRVVNEVHEGGGKIVPQLWHVGAMRPPSYDAPNRHLPSATPSGRFAPGSKRIGEGMTREEIDIVIDAFARAAADAQRLGFDGVEVHAAHGYIVDQFLWSELNERTDEYGGDAFQRTHFATRLIAAIRSEIDADFPLIFRISQWKQQDYSARLARTAQELESIVRPMSDAGVDIFHCSQRRWWQPEFEGSDLNLAGWVKKLTGRPTISVGSVGLDGPMSVTEHGRQSQISTDFTALGEALARGDFDLIAVGRALLADADWFAKIREGRYAALKPYSKSTLDQLD